MVGFIRCGVTSFGNLDSSLLKKKCLLCTLPNSTLRQQKKKSRRSADIFSRAFEAVALIFRAAASFCLLLT